MSYVEAVRPKDWVDFHCRLCGNCCRKVEGQIMLEALDAYRLGQYLRERGRAHYIESVYNQYAHPDLLEGCYPFFLLNTVGSEQSCVFLEDGRCSVYEARPKVCRLYPFTVNTGQRGKDFVFYKCMDCHAAHFSDGRVLVKDWTYQNFKAEDRAFLKAESAAVPELGRLLRALEPAGREEILFQFLYCRYFNYDLDQPFMPQYVKNLEELKKNLRDALRR